MPRPLSLRSKHLIQVGSLALLLWLLLGGVVLVSIRLGFKPVLQLPLRPFGSFLGFGALACFAGGWLLHRPSKRQLLQVVCILFVGLNVLSYLGAYALTHYQQPGQWSWGRPKPASTRQPTDIGLTYTTHRIPTLPSEWIETWVIPAAQPQGTVLLFHGNHGTKGNQLLAPAQRFHQLHYNTMLVDFRGAGGSSGSTTSLGFWEAEDVELVIQQAQQLSLTPPLVLYGVSMGSAAVLRAIAHHNVQPDAIILELPFTRLTNAIENRLSAFHLPTFPFTELLVFWGGIQQGFNGFTHNPSTYAQQVTCPSLILQGQQDRWITLSELKVFQQQFRGPTQQVLFPTAGHQLLITVDSERWQHKISQFLADRQP